MKRKRGAEDTKEITRRAKPRSTSDIAQCAAACCVGDKDKRPVCIRPPNLQHDATSHLRHHMPASPGGVSASPGITSQRLQPSNVWAMKCICCASETETCTDARRPCKEKPGRDYLHAGGNSAPHPPNNSAGRHLSPALQDDQSSPVLAAHKFTSGDNVLCSEDENHSDTEPPDKDAVRCRHTDNQPHVPSCSLQLQSLLQPHSANKEQSKPGHYRPG
ncbi:hypothetical protein Anapl_14517 [Anas platyrhynchos]|uniref:Uncharacterized protein n=1 Tax=Anas platyrhynchos TaxID=8839 RepID=R0LAH2_ANAPL|nr:hypothetical protein Anapl_14517 [Anas platyrhynchos]